MFNRASNQRGIVVTLFALFLVVFFVASLRPLRPFPYRGSPASAPDSQHSPVDADEWGSSSSSSSSSGGGTRPEEHDVCAEARSRPAAGDTLVVVKTGANEIFEKLPTLLLTALRDYQPCTDLLIFSDLAQKLGPYEIYDALDSVTSSIKDEHPDFDYYRTLQEYQKNGQDLSQLRASSQEAAWNLDKYKFLHMLEKTWKMQPMRKWYVFIEADTYLVHTNLKAWLAQLDPSRPYYFGSPTSLNGEAFPHGGSGFILSNRALALFAEGNEGIAARYDSVVQNERFGDYVCMKALQKCGVGFSPAWPLLQAEKPSTIPFGRGPDTGVRHWCQPIVTMHHIRPDEASRIWAFEQTRPDRSQPVLLRDFYEGMVAAQIEAERDDWYNLSDDVMYVAPGVENDRQKAEEDMSALEREAYLSFEHCGRACQEQERCFQWTYTDQSCGFSYSYRLGNKHEAGDGEAAYKSGWLLDRIAEDRAAQTCSSQAWPGWGGSLWG